MAVNWCSALGTVLANEEVIDGRSERGGHPVIRRPIRQWMLRITAYADRLLEDLDLVDWPEPVKRMQREWIGRSDGAEVRFDPETKAGVSNLLVIHSVLSGSAIADLESEFAGRGYGDLKKAVADVVVEAVTPFRTRMTELLTAQKT